MRSLISVRDLSKEDVSHILDLARSFREGKEDALEGDVVLMFLEPSTRTRISFEKACRKLGLETYSVVGDSSSLTKGESFYDTLKTFSALGYKAVVFRTPFVLFPYDNYLSGLDLSLINAGDGTHQHPTQGLIDLLTIMDKLGDLEGKNILYVGDITHSRVFRSGAPILTMFGAKVSVCAPKTLIPRDIDAFGVEKTFKDLEEAMDWADAVIWLRLQKERQKENLIPSAESYFRLFGLTKERYKKIKGYFMHPGPVNRGIDIDGDLLYSDKSLIQEQVKNGLYVRMAVVRWCLS